MIVAKKNKLNKAAQNAEQYNAEFAEETAAGNNAARAAQKQNKKSSK